ncbi:MAG TPA: sensor domain-containing diguanylate cyclase [Gammaproteobacteria bacterium]
MEDRESLLARIAALEESEHYFRTLYETSPDAILLIDPERGIFDCNPASLTMFRAASRQALCQLRPAALSAGHQSGWIPSSDLMVQHMAEAFEQGHSRFEWQARRLDGTEFPVHVTLIAVAMRNQRVVQCVMRDQTELKNQERAALRAHKALEQSNRELQVALEQLQLAASTDQLTSAWNRRFFNRVISTERARAARSGNPLSLILVDIDHFKVINDTHGHLVGDRVLVEMAALLQESLRQTDYLIRWGGEEFAILTPELDAENGAQLAERLRDRVSHHRFNGGLTLTISAGVAQLHDDDILTRWVSRADTALYSAKTGGRNRVVMAAASA